MSENPEPSEEFEVDDGYLIHRVTPEYGRPYVHRCSLASYKELASSAEELGKSGFSVESLLQHVRNQPLTEGASRQPRVSLTNTAVALAFWRDRGFIEKRFRKNYIDDRCFYESAMIEFLAMGEA